MAAGSILNLIEIPYWVSKQPLLALWQVFNITSVIV